MKSLLIILLLFSTLQLFSQSDPKSKSILNKVTETTKSYSSITASFDFTMQNTNVGLKETSSGNLILQKENYKLTFNGFEIFSNGKIQWTYMPDANEVTINNADNEEEEIINPATIFNIYEKGFKNTFAGEFTNNGKKVFRIELTPLEIKEFTKIMLDIEQSTNQIVSATLLGTDKNTYIITVKSMITNKNYDASTFVFNTKKNPKVQVVDMR
jgi:outer membrane lipoprotein-sorting protein